MYVSLPDCSSNDLFINLQEDISHWKINETVSWNWSTYNKIVHSMSKLYKLVYRYSTRSNHRNADNGSHYAVSDPFNFNIATAIDPTYTKKQGDGRRQQGSARSPPQQPRQHQHQQQQVPIDGKSLDSFVSESDKPDRKSGFMILRTTSLL